MNNIDFTSDKIFLFKK